MWRYNKFETLDSPPSQPAVDGDLYAAIESGKSPNQLMQAVKPHFERIEAGLVEQELRHSSGQRSQAANWVVVFISIIGGLRLKQGYPDPDPGMLAMSVTVLGTSAVAGIEGYAPLASLAPSVGRSGASAGYGSGCGGGGCGG